MDTLVERRCGAVTLKIGTEYDEDPDLSYLGRFTSLRKAAWDKPLYSRDDRTMRMAKSDLWRDGRGRICAAPPDDSYAREYRYIVPSGCGDPDPKYLRMDAERLDAYGRNQWYMVGIVATVYVDGREIGSASCWGFESDSGDRYLRSEARQIAMEAIDDARAWLARRDRTVDHA